MISVCKIRIDAIVTLYNVSKWLEKHKNSDKIKYILIFMKCKVLLNFDKFMLYIRDVV